MISNKDNIPPIVHLKFKKGELIIKEGDYGISIYKIIKGKVGIYSESGDTKIALATLGRGEVLGEMTFLNNATQVRSASAIALEDSELEAWHPAMLSSEYENMPPIVKYLTNQSLNRLIRMNKLISDLGSMSRQEKDKKTPAKDPWAPQREYYRKDVDLEASYRPTGPLTKAVLTGRIKDISLGGLGLEVSPRNTLHFPHDPGSTFIINSVLPNGKKIDFRAKLTIINKEKTPGRLFLGMHFIDMSDGVRKKLGFFLMP